MQAIFGPSDPLLGPHVQSICDALDIPHLETRLDLESRTGARNELSINLHPSQEVLNAAYKDLMRFLNWTKVAIIYEDEGGTVPAMEKKSISSFIIIISRRHKTTLDFQVHRRCKGSECTLLNPV